MSEVEIECPTDGTGTLSEWVVWEFDLSPEGRLLRMFEELIAQKEARLGVPK